MSDVTASELNATVPSREHKLSENYLVKTGIARLDKSITRTGRKRNFTPTRMRNEINKYLGWCEENDRVPSIKGLMIHLKMHKSQFYTYCEYPEFMDIMEQARLVISEWCENDVYRTPGAASGKIAYMKNIHGWTEKIEQEVTKTLTVDDARIKLESLLPGLIEKIKQQGIEMKLNDRDIVVDILPEEIN